MGFIKEFSYPDIFQRRVIYYNSFVSSLTLGYIYTDIILSLKYYFFYFSVLKFSVVILSLGLFFGNLLGKFLFSRFKEFRSLYILSDITFILFSILIIIRKLFSPSLFNPILEIFYTKPNIIILILFILPFIAGIKINYFSKIACGEFIDDRKGIIPFIFSLISGLIAGISFMLLIQHFFDISYFAVAIPAIILPSIFLIRLPYNPFPIYAREFKEVKDEPVEHIQNSKTKEGLYFSYLNFTYIIIYFFLGYQSIEKFYGDFMYIKSSFIGVFLISVSIGFFIAKMSKVAFWYIYSEMLFPVVFLVFLVLLNNYINIPFYIAALFFIPASIVYGFSLYHTIMHILSRYNHNKRMGIINFLIFILPVPIIISIVFIDFTVLLYFVLLYSLAILNFIIPGIHLMQRDVRSFKKIIYFFFSLIFIPLVIFMHLYFKIPLNNELYIRKSKGIDKIRKINFNSDFILKNANVYLNKTKAFTATNNNITNIKRSILAINLYKKDYTSGILIIDGNQKFFRNNLLGLLGPGPCIDYIPERIVDFQGIQLTGKQNYIVETMDIMFYLQKKGRPFSLIMDLPNQYDLKLNSFRFSEEYHKIIKRYLQKDGFFSQVLDLSACTEKHLSSTLLQFKKYYKFYQAYLFSNYLVLMGSDDENTFQLSGEKISNIGSLIQGNDQVRPLFYNEYHLLSHLLFNGSFNNPTNNNNAELKPALILDSKGSAEKLKTFADELSKENSLFLKLIDSKKDPYLIARIKSELHYNNNIYTLLKNMEFAEGSKNYEEETNLLFQLKKYTEYKTDLRSYINRILAHKEEYYYQMALELERKTKWEEAKRLYSAILVINNDNFEANYRLGILNITLQKLDDSFKYLQKAMSLSKENPKVLYQMGVLLFSSGTPSEAINYFRKALNLNWETASLYLYMGLCYEELGELYNLNTAERYYKDALKRDPNDENIKSSLVRIADKIEKEKNRWAMPERTNQADVEQDEKLPIPIIKSAIDKRLSEKEAESMGENENEQEQ